MGQLVGGGEIDRDEVAGTLLDAAVSAGLTETEARKTIESGLNSGSHEPRKAKKQVAAQSEQGTPEAVSQGMEPPLFFDEIVTPEISPDHPDITPTNHKKQSNPLTVSLPHLSQPSNLSLANNSIRGP